MSVGILMRLVDEGKLDVNARVNGYLSAFGAYKTDITVAQLVSNSSGLVTLAGQPALRALPVPVPELGGTLTDCGKNTLTADDAADIQAARYRVRLRRRGVAARRRHRRGGERQALGRSS